MKVLASINAILANPQKDINKNEQIDFLRKEVEKIQAMPNKIEAIVKLFQVISPIQDAGGFSNLINKLQKKNYGQLDPKIDALSILQSHIHNAGRSEYGLNRTKKGETVTSEKVYLGNVFGIWTKTAAYWLSREEELKQVFRDDLTKNPNQPVTTWYCINDYQAGAFVKSHVEGILEQISIIKKQAA
ncbi:MAG: hypothetical protein NT165_02040 [Candidatus Falkowbacteria bacterium]|nr:hypothetical protein [Candidatus Falkowbacteria bacterium]